MLMHYNSNKEVMPLKTYATDDLPLVLQNFIQDYSEIYQKALVDTVNRRLCFACESKSELNTYLQLEYSINKRQANDVITEADGMIGSAALCRANHIKQLQGKLKSAEDWLRKKEKSLRDSRKFYRSKNWQVKKVSPKLKFACYLDSRKTSWQQIRFAIHHKKRYIAHLKRKIEALKVAPIRVSIPKDPHSYFVGSKGETCGNQVCQFDGVNLKVRVPKALEAKYGDYVECTLNSFPYGQQKILEAINTSGVTVGKYGTKTPIRYGLAMTYRFYAKNFRWFMAVSFDLPSVSVVARPVRYGAIGIDLNPDSIGWAYTDNDGNLTHHGQIPLYFSGKRTGQVKAIIGDAVCELTTLATTFSCPIVCESLDFSRKKQDLRERGRKYARMLSNFSYSRFFESLSGRCGNLGIELIQVNPAYSTVIGLVKYSKMYGLSSAESAALVVSRRGMRLSERLPPAITALLQVNCSRHVWHRWSQLNKKLTGVKRHAFYGIPNWELLVNPPDEEVEQSTSRSGGKRKR